MVDAKKTLYVQPSTSTLVQASTPNEMQSQTIQTQQEIDQSTYPTSERNFRKSYIIPTEKDSVYLNFVAEKQFISDNSLHTVVDASFSYFIEQAPLTIIPLTYPDGTIFRCASQGVRKIEDYTYYIMQNSIGQPIPNWKSVEVLMAERGITSSAIRVLESSECRQMVIGPSADDLSSSWDSSMQDLTNAQQLAKLTENAQTAQQIVAGAQAEATKQVNAVQAQADADKAAAAASAQQAAAAQAASAAAIVQASAQQAQAAAAQAAAEAAKAEAEAAKAEFESQQGN